MYINVIEFLQSIADPVQGTNLMYRYDNGLLLEKDEVFRHSFYNHCMATFYYTTLKDVKNAECTLTENKEIQYSTRARIIQVLNEENILENQIEYYNVPTHEIFRFDLVFKSSIQNILNQQYRLVI